MRRTLLSILIGLCLTWPCAAQDPNPQSSFASTESLAGPSFALNFNDQTAGFKDQISGSSFVGTKTFGGAPLTIPNGMTAAGYFNGTNSYVSTQNTSALNPSAITVAGWIYATGFANSYTTVFCNAGSVAEVMVKSNGKLAIYMFTSGGMSDYDGSGSTTIATGTWYYVSVTYDSTHGLIGYVNGAVDGTGAASGTLNSNNGPTNFGYFSGTWPARIWTGLLSGFSVYNSALTQAQIQSLQAGGSITTGLIGQWALNEAAGSTAVDSSSGGNNGTWNGTASGDAGYYEGSKTITSGTVSPRQPGFDSTLLNNTSAEFPWNGWSAAPNNTLGAIEWNTPWSMMVQVDRLNWNRTGTLTLASKGDLSSGTYWKLYLQMTANTTSGANGQVSQLCFSRSSTATAPNIPAHAINGICTSSGFESMPNGFNYNIVVTDSGTGLGGWGGGSSALDIYINGIDRTTSLYEIPFSASYQYGFGAVGIAYSGGTGYANSTAFTSSGGGANCNVTGTLVASGGAPYGIGFVSDYGCTSVPTITLTSPTGTGVTLTPSLAGTSMNSTSYPLMVPGYVSGGAYYGVAGATSTQTPTYIDEFAIFPVSLNQTQINDLFYWTKFYQILANTRPANPIVMLYDTDGCTDIANAMGTQLAIVLDTLGILKIEGVVTSNLGNGMDIYDSSGSILRQMFDQAGLSDVPVGVLYTGTDYDSTWCKVANVNTYNASTPQTSAGFPTSTAVARTVFAENPTTPVIIFNGSAPSNNWLADFLQSPADSISSLTGQQLWDRDVANGGAMWWQGNPSCTATSYPNPPMVPCSSSWTNPALDGVASQYLFNHLDGMPTYQAESTPQSYGQGLLYTRTSKDPMYLACAAVSVGPALGCSRAGWGQYAMASLFSSYFTGGVAVGYSGGTGYANLTPFTSTGGGANCVVNGIMTASGGVPNGVETSWGMPLPMISVDGLNVGIGSGCTSAPTLVLTSPIGTGVTLTAYPTTVCGTGSVTMSGSTGTYNFSSATCSNQYVVPFTVWANNGEPLIYNWFLNSLSDPPTNGRPLR